MSPRKSSTSYVKPSFLRPRYLGLEVAGVALPPSKDFERALVKRLNAPEIPVRVIRRTRDRAIVAIPHTAVKKALRAWNLEGWRTVRTFGTLVKAKRWARNMQLVRGASYGSDSPERAT